MSSSDVDDVLAQLRRQRQRVEEILRREEVSDGELPPNATDEERREFWARRFEAARKARRATR